MANVRAPIKNDRYIKVILSELIPRLIGKSKKMAIAATVGIVKPILARAEPKAKFKLLCRRFALAALTAGLRSELIDTNITVTTVYPGAIATNIALNSGINLSDLSTPNKKIKMTSPEKAAALILKAIEKNTAHLFIGRDAKTMNFLTRLNPLFAARIIQKQMKGLLK